MPNTVVPSAPEALSALEEIRARAEKLSDQQLVRLNVNVNNAVVLGLHVAKSVKADRDKFAKILPTLPPVYLDSIEMLSLALGAANHLFLNAQDDPQAIEEEIKKLAQEALESRNLLLKGADFIWSENSAVSDIIARIRKGRGYKDRADDLMALSLLFQERWDEAKNKTFITLEQVKKAGELAARMLRFLGPERENDSKNVKTARKLRNQVWTLFLETYDEIRAAGLYIHRHNPDANELYPSLHSMKERKKTQPAPEVVEG